MKREREPAVAARLRDAVELALGGDWQAAHRIVQDLEGDEAADWIHAVVHRMEGDLGNARYWYRRCGRTLREEVTSERFARESRCLLSRRGSAW